MISGLDTGERNLISSGLGLLLHEAVREERARKRHHGIDTIGASSDELRALDQRIRHDSKATLAIRLEHETRDGDYLAIVDGTMVTDDDGGRGTYATEPNSEGDPDADDPAYRWRNQQTRAWAADWLEKALDAALEEYDERGMRVEAAERAAGWDPNP